jgi:hypothetical protein
MYAILFRAPLDKITTLYETDDRDDAVSVLRGAAMSPVIKLIDFSPELDGELDETLRVMEGIKIGYSVGTAA